MGRSGRRRGSALGRGQESESGEASSTTDTTGSRRRVPGDESFDRDRIVQDHELHRLVYSYMMPKTSEKLLEKVPASPPLSSIEHLPVITLAGLTLKTQHSNRVLYGRLCVIPFKNVAIHTVLEETAGRAVRVAIHDALPLSASQREAAKQFPSGMLVAIREPFFGVCEGGKPAVLVYNPADIVPVQKSDCADSGDRSSTQIRETLERFRGGGNELFGKGDWIGAVSKYTACIDKASGITIANKDNDCQRQVMLAYANRAEARLRLKNYYDALNDSIKALDIDPKHAKTLVRKGKAEHALGRFTMARETFANALALASEEKDRWSVSKNLKASETSLLQSWQSQYGYFDLTNFYLTGKAPSCADFVGPVEIRRTDYGGGRRGLFATRSVAPGQVLLVSNPVAMIREVLDIPAEPSGKRHFVLKQQMEEDLIAQLLNRAKTSKRCLAQLHSLGMNEPEEMEIPSMDLFTPGSEWVPPGMDNLNVEGGKLALIGKANAFVHETNVTGEDETDVGLWALPAFANHSCAPNCIMVFVGAAMFFRAAREIVAENELTISYLDLEIHRDRKSRQERLLIMGVTCECERCKFEDDFISTHSNLNLWASSEAPTVDKVEGMIRSCHSELEPRKQYWIRAAHMTAYYANDPGTAKDNAPSRSVIFRKARFQISTLQILMEAMAAVSVYPAALTYGALLLIKVRLLESLVGSEAVSRTEERVLEVCSTFYGMAPKKFLLDLLESEENVNKRFDAINSTERAPMPQRVCPPMQR